jgi:hypothetical protein
MLFSCMRGSIERVRRRTEAGTPIHRHVPSGRTGDTMKRAIRSTPLPLDRTAAITAVCALCACAALAVSPRAHAATLADAVASGQAGGNATELDLLGSPKTYTDPYGSPVDGKGGQRGPVTNAQTARGTTPTDKLLAQQDGVDRIPGGAVQLRPLARNRNAQAMSPEGAAAALYRPPAGAKPPAPARAREIYKSPW